MATVLGVHEGARKVLNARITAGKQSVKLFSRQTGISQPHVSMFRNGKRKLSVDTLSRVLDTLGFSVEVLPRRTHPERP